MAGVHGSIAGTPDRGVGGMVVASVRYGRADLDTLERVAYRNEELHAALPRLCRALEAEEMAILSTCNRAELYARFDGGASGPRLVEALALDRRFAASHLQPVTFQAAGPCVVRHLFRVTSGLDSPIVGEQEIQGQVRTAYRLAKEAGTLDGGLDTLFRWAINVGRRVRHNTGLGSSGRSVAKTAVDAAARLCHGLEGRVTLVAGAGKLAEAVVRRARAFGADVIVWSRTEEHARRLAGRAERVRAVAQLGQGLQQAEVVFCCTSAGHHLLGSQEVVAAVRRRGHLTIVDLGMPRNVERAVAAVPGVSLVDLGSLCAAGTGSDLEAMLSEAEAIVAEQTSRFLSWTFTRAAACEGARVARARS